MEPEKHALTPNEIGDCLGGMTVQGVYRVLKSHNIHAIHTHTNRKLIPPYGVRKILKERGFDYPKLNISFQIVKGGVGKTSLSFSLAIRACHYGARVLSIDLDQQGNLTRSFNIEARNTPVWLNIIRDGYKIDQAIIPISDHLHLIPSNLNNSRLDVELTQNALNLKDMMRDALSNIRDQYDLVIIDCPPAINKINTAATCASDLIVIPINPDPYAMDGLEFTLAELAKIRKDFKLSFDYRIIWNRYDARERLGAYYMHELAKNEDRIHKILPVVIRTDTSLKNAVFDSKTIFDLPKKATIREDIDQFTRELLGINAWREVTKSN
jgi:chromosome partitioning protein